MNLPAAERQAIRLARGLFFGAVLLVVFVLGFALATRWMQKAEGEVAAPDLLGRDLSLALVLCAEQGLTCKAVGQENSEEQPLHAVLRQSPAAGEAMRRERPLLLTVSGGAREVVVPDLGGTPLELARYVLESNELTAGRVSHLCGPAPRQLVLAQNPSPAARRSRGSAVDLLVSAGPCDEPFLMPELRGLPLAQVLQELEGQGFLLHQVQLLEKEGVPEETILEQDPPAGRWVRRLDRLLLTSTPSAAAEESGLRLTWLRLPLPPRLFRQKIAIRVHSPAGMGYSWEEFVGLSGAYSAVVPAAPGTTFTALLEGRPAPLFGRAGFLPAAEWERRLGPLPPPREDRP